MPTLSDMDHAAPRPADDAATDAVEAVAVGSSMLCLLHCLALPLILAAAPSLGRTLGMPTAFHMWMVALAVPASGIALWSGWSRHGRIGPVIAGLAGLAMLAVGVTLVEGTAGEIWLTVCGSLTLATVHVANWRLRRDAA